MKSLLTLSVLCVCLTSNAQDTLSIYFDFNSSSISSEGINKLKTFSKSKYDQVTSISAYCDTVGTSNYNQKLAKRRLNSVLYLVQTKAKSTSLNGESAAAKMENYDAAEARRVDIIYTTLPDITSPAYTEGQVILKKEFNDFVASSEKTKTMDLKLLFIPGYPVLIKTSVPEIQELYELMNDNPGVDAYIHGHVCCADDYKLSYDRGVMVHDYLTTRGISKDRLKYMGHSNKDPKVNPEVTEADRLANRRVTVVFTKR